jgi:hypothetical protein
MEFRLREIERQQTSFRDAIMSGTFQVIGGLLAVIAALVTLIGALLVLTAR